MCPVPDGSRPAAIQISAELGLPYREVRLTVLGPICLLTKLALTRSKREINA